MPKFRTVQLMPWSDLTDSLENWVLETAEQSLGPAGAGEGTSRRTFHRCSQ
jgi:hypothetical protein